MLSPPTISNSPIILTVGLVTADFIFRVEEFPSTPEKFTASDAEMILGGGAANAALAITRLNGHAMLAGRIGDDVIGKLILGELERNGIDCAKIQQCAGARSSFSSILIDAAGERQIVNFRGDGLSVDTHCFKENPNYDAIVSDTRWVQGAVAAMQLARKHSIPGIIDAEAPVSIEAMSLATHIGFSRQGLKDYSQTDDIKTGLLKAQQQFLAWVCVTDGAAGACFLEQGSLVNMPAPSVTVKDTLGAGDTWHGVFALQLAEGKDEIEACRYANAAASLKCTRRGGGLAAPTKPELDAFIQEHLKVARS